VVTKRVTRVRSPNYFHHLIHSLARTRNRTQGTQSHLNAVYSLTQRKFLLLHWPDVITDRPSTLTLNSTTIDTFSTTLPTESGHMIPLLSNDSFKICVNPILAHSYWDSRKNIFFRRMVQTFYNISIIINSEDFVSSEPRGNTSLSTELTTNPVYQVRVIFNWNKIK